MRAVRFLLPVLASLLAPGALAADGRIQPGQWRTTDTVLEMVNPQLPHEVIARRKAKPAVAEYCVTSESVRDLVLGRDATGRCAGEVSFEGGRISGTRTCAGGAGQTTRKIEGTYAATRIDTIREATAEVGKGKAHTKSRVVSERVGECR